jgi:pantoate--beta-alanine ligase
MIVLRTRSAVLSWRAGLQGPLAFVPTMGFFHDGHLSLMREGRRRAGPDGTVAISIFVNPTQFGPNEDLDAYPRDEAGDLAKAAGVGVDVAVCPTDPRELYAGSKTWVEVEGLDRHLCGRARPGHFRGVCTVVAKLWGLIRPDVAIFGEKDYQQLAILRRMHADLCLGGEVLGMPIAREADGLAMSSRNANLTERSRQEALAIPEFMDGVRRRFAAGERRSAALLAGAAEALRPGRVDYVELVDAADLEPVETIERPALCAVAVFFPSHGGGEVRLIDNAVLSP